MGLRTASPDSRLAVIQPQLNGRGGLEKYCVYLTDEITRHQSVDVVTEHQVDPERLYRSFNVKLDRPRFVCDPRSNPEPPAGTALQNAIRRQQAVSRYEQLTRPYDLVFGHTISLPWRCASRRSVLICHFPTVRRHRVDPSVPSQGLSSLLTGSGREQRDIRSRVNSWSRIVVSSEFARRWVGIYWDREAEVIYPPIEQPSAPDLSEKRNWIVGAGYFNRPTEPGDAWGYKRQEVLIDTFRKACDAGLTGWELHLAGHVLLAPPDDQKYLEELRQRAPGYPVFFHANCPHSELISLYRHGSIFWHAAGYKMDQEKVPDRMEHFGMTTAEAMGFGCIPVVINRGGQPEIVEVGKSGYVWDTDDDCVAHTLRLANNPDERRRIAEGALKRADHFSVERFRERVRTLLAGELELLAGGRA
jgi:glycosyltransferase involved in cell wall biosynthesis